MLIVNERPVPFREGIRMGDLVDEITERISDFTDRFLGREVRDLSAAASRLAQTTFEAAFSWGLGPDDLARMAEVLRRAQEEVDEIRREARKGRRKKGPGTARPEADDREPEPEE